MPIKEIIKSLVTMAGVSLGGLQAGIIYPSYRKRPTVDADTWLSGATITWKRTVVCEAHPLKVSL